MSVSNLNTICGDIGYLGIDEPEPPSGFVLGEAFGHEVFHHLLGDAYACAAGTEEDGALLSSRNLGALDCVDEATEDDRAGALDIVIEAGVGFLVSLESAKGVLKVLELNHDAVNV